VRVNVGKFVVVMENLKISAVIKQPLHVEFVSQMNSREMAKQLAQYELDVSAEL
jgi:hypothetical protein